MGELIAILSGKGGTGKTTVCAAIATALAASGKQVLAMDCDVGLRNLDIPLGLGDQDALSFLDICSGSYSLDQAVRHPQFSSLAFLTAPVNCDPADIDGNAFRDMLQSAREHFDYILLDAPAGIDSGFRLCAAYADRVILVTGGDPASIRDAGRAGELLERMGKPGVRLIVNRVNKKLYKRLRLTVDDIMDDAGLPLLGIVPDDARVVLCAMRHKPLLMRNKKGAAAACRRIARRIQGEPVPISLR